MLSDHDGELESQLDDGRLPSLLALRCFEAAARLENHAEPLFVEKVGPVCRPDKVPDWFSTGGSGPCMKPGGPRLHTRTRPGAWREWASAAKQGLPKARGQTFEHFYFSLQAAIAGLGVAIGPWHLVRDDLDSGVLAAPLGFVEDGSRYCLLAPAPLAAGSPQADLLAWLRTMA